ncbi:MAG TPA: hypothetical protein VHX88_01545 [Solirubrobacteraceae bacterium]|nr:hypothetical protein [Solirubrobacteraceae bacterium]
MNRARLLAGAVAAGRVAIGAGLIAAPERVTRGWIGPDSERPSAHALARSLGVRDMVIGMIALHTLSHPEVGPRWQRTCAGVDAVDCAGTLLAARSLPARGVAATAVIATGAAAVQLWCARALAA